MNRKGFTLIEIMVAIVILVIGILALAKTMGVVTYLVGLSSRQTAADAFTRGIYEEQFGLGCTTRINGASTLQRGSATAAISSWSWTTPDTTPGILPALNDRIHRLMIVTSYPVSAGKIRTDTFETEVICVK